MGNSVRNIVKIRGNLKAPYSIIIVAAGMGNRMKTYGVKSLIEIAPGLTILQHQLNIIKENLKHNPDIILVTGFESDKLNKHLPPNIISVENENFATTNVVRSIGIGLKITKTPHVIILYGDLIFNKYAFPFFPLTSKSSLVIDTLNTMSENEVGCIINNNIIEHVWYDLPNKWAQIMMLTGKELSLAKSISGNHKFYNFFGCELINEIIKQGGTFYSHKPRKLKVNDIDTIKDFSIVSQVL